MGKQLKTSQIQESEVTKYKTKTNGNIEILLKDGKIAILKCDNDNCSSTRFKTSFEPYREFYGGTAECTACKTINVLPQIFD